MKIIVCLDDLNGMMFNHRRQSRDRVVVSDILNMVGGNALYMAEYSRSLFLETDAHYIVSEDFLEQAERGAWCFVEDRGVSGYTDRIEEIVIYRWNRHYPSDLYFDLNWNTHGFQMIERIEFSGHSHDTITKEIFKK